MSSGGGTRVSLRSPSYGTSYGSYNITTTMPVSSRKPPPYSYGSSGSYTPTSRGRTNIGSSTYTSSYGSSSRSRTPSATRNRSPPRDDRYDDLERRTRALQSPKARPLPRGPGFRDRNGDPASTTDTIKDLRANLKRHSSLSRDTTTRSRAPLKADYSTNSLDRSTRFRSVEPEVNSRLSRSKRAGSVADISSRFENLSTSPTSSRLSKKYGSTTDLIGSPRVSVMDDGPSLGYGSKHSTTTSSYNSDKSTLPDISISNKSSRSPSVDSWDLINTSRKSVEPDDEIFNSSSSSTTPKRTYGKSRQNSNVSVSSYTSNGMTDHKSRDSGSERGLIGLQNIGNTCFMNSVLQGLSNTRLLLEYCLDDDYKDHVNTRTSSMKGQLIKVFANVLKSLWKSGAESSVTPSEFKNQIARFAKRFVGYNQQDAQEFLIYLLEGLHEDINRVTDKRKRVIDDCSDVETISATDKAALCWNRYIDVDNSKIVDLCVGQLRSALTCNECDYVSNTFDPFWDLSLPIAKSRSTLDLDDCFKLFTQEETLDGDERPTCARCKKRQQCSKRFYIQRFPKILILHLKRFNQGSYIRSKLSTMVDFPLENLDLSKYASPENRVRAHYNLYAVSNHSGSTGGGHYTAYAKNPYSGDWHHFNDQRVSKISASRVVSSEAYVLFYELKGSNSHL